MCTPSTSTPMTSPDLMSPTRATGNQVTRLLYRIHAVCPEPVGLHLDVDTRATDAELPRRRGRVALALERRSNRGALDGADRLVGDVLERLALAEAVEVDRRQVDAIGLLRRGSRNL